MKKNIVFLIAALVIMECRGQRGLPLSYSTNHTLEIDVFARESNNGAHLGYSHQFNGQKGKIESTQSDNPVYTEIGKGKYFWTVDFGARLFW